VPGTIDQDYPTISGEQLAKRLPHHLQIGAGAMDHHDGGTDGIARADVHDVERCAGDLDHPALRGKSALQREHTGLRDQRESSQRRHHNDCYHLQSPDEFGHQRVTVLRRRGFAAKAGFARCIAGLVI
jgi:hypothetical protein